MDVSLYLVKRAGVAICVEIRGQCRIQRKRTRCWGSVFQAEECLLQRLASTMRQGEEERLPAVMVHDDGPQIDANPRHIAITEAAKSASLEGQAKDGFGQRMAVLQIFQGIIDCLEYVGGCGEFPAIAQDAVAPLLQAHRRK